MGINNRPDTRVSVRVLFRRNVIVATALLLLAVSSHAAAQTLPAGWYFADIGVPLIGGSATFGNDVFSVAATTANTLNTADQLSWVFDQADGDVVFTGRLTSFAGSGTGAEAGLMIRESILPGSKQVSILLTSANTIVMETRLTTDGPRTVAAISGSAAAAPVWFRLVRSASVITAFRSADGVTWSSVGAVTVPMAPTVYAGMAVTGGSTTLSLTATRTALQSTTTFEPSTATSTTTTTNAKFDRVNHSPKVSISSPASGATYMAPAAIAISADARDVDGTIAKVDFYAGATLIGSDAASPYGITWSASQAGGYTLTAVATDDKGAKTTSSAVSITVSAGNQSPSVSLTAPANGATFTAPATITVSATASDVDGTITSVEFYAGSTLIGSTSTAPYSKTWSNVPAGSYSLTAVARDNANGMTVSGARSIIVTDPQTPTTAVFTPSTDNDTDVTSYEIEIYPAGANPGSANPVATQDLGKPPVVNGQCQVDIHALIQSLAPGTYFGTVTAFGSTGAASSSPSPTFTR